MLSALLVLAALTFQSEPAPAPPAADGVAVQVKQLVQQLDAREKTAREAAEQSLLDLGPKALEHLPEPTARTSAEVKQRLARVRGKLEKALADSNKEATKITLTGEMKLSEAIDSIANQSGNKLYLAMSDDGESAGDEKFTFEIKDEPFWQALDKVLDQASLSVNPYGDQVGLAISRRADMAAPRVGRAVYMQAFRIAPLDISAQRDFASGVGNTLQLQLEGAWEPRLVPVIVTVPMSAVTATDDQGKSLAVQGSEQEFEIPVGPGQSTVDMQLAFDLPERTAQKLTSVKGRLNVLLPGRAETFTFAKIDKAKKTSQTKAGVTVTIEEVWKNNDAWEVRVLTRFEDAAGSLQSHLNWVFNNEAKLVAPNGEEIPYDSLETTSEDENEVGMAYIFAREQGLSDHTFIYRTPTSVTEVALDFELTDLDLP
jgi:hypothetical protein